MKTSAQALDHVKAFIEANGGAEFADKTARELTGQGEAALWATMGSFRQFLCLYMSETMAFAIGRAFEAMVRERMRAI